MLNVSPWNLLFVVLNLLILLALMKKFLYKPVLGIIAKRQELIDRQFAEARAAAAEAEKLKNEYEASLCGVQEEKEKIIKEARAQARAEYDKILTDVEGKAREILDDAKKAGLEEKEKTVKDAEEEIAKLAAMAASKIVAQTSGETQNYAIYEEFLKKAGEKRETDGK